MDDDRVWMFEESLWTADPEHYRESIDPDVLMALPSRRPILSGEEAIEAVTDTPRWSRVDMTERHVSRPQDGLIVVAYTVEAGREGEDVYQAHCTSTYRRLGPDDWKVVQHQQTPVLRQAAVAEG